MCVVRVSCPECGGSILTEGIPERLPTAVPDHRADDGRRCTGSGRPSSQAWMVNPYTAGDQPATLFGGPASSGL
jgi:hypothetical protein